MESPSKKGGRGNPHPRVHRTQRDIDRGQLRAASSQAAGPVHTHPTRREHAIQPQETSRSLAKSNGVNNFRRTRPPNIETATGAVFLRHHNGRMTKGRHSSESIFQKFTQNLLLWVAGLFSTTAEHRQGAGVTLV